MIFLVETVARMSLREAFFWLADPDSFNSARYSYLWMLCLCGLLYAITNRLAWSCALGSLVVLLLAAIHAGKMLILQQPLVPGDFLLIGLVLDIWSSAYFPFGFQQVVFFVLVCALVAVCARWFMAGVRMSARIRLVVGGIALLGLYYYTVNARVAAARTVPVDKKLTVAWTPEDNHAIDSVTGVSVQNPDFSVAFNYKNFGFIAGLFQNLTMTITGTDTLEDYTREGVEAAWGRFFDLRDQESERLPSVALEADLRPHVVVVLMESLWDPTWLQGVSIHPDPLAAFRRIAASSNAVPFLAVSPIFGGYTCNAEFELLSGMAMGLLPPQLVPHRQSFRGQVTTLPAVFKHNGYTTRAIHPFLPEFWNRNLIYPLIGFEEFTHIGNMKNRGVRGKFISDDALADEIISTVEASPGPAFVFAISMQNHSPYGDHRYGDVERETITVHEGKIKEHALRDYVHGVRDADAMLDKLTRHLADEERPVLLLFMGDHQPSLVPADATPGEFIQRIKPGYVETGLAVKARYFNLALLWSSRGDLPVLPGPALSMAALPSMILRHVNLPLPPFMELSNRVFAGYPVLHNGWGLRADGSTHLFRDGDPGVPLLEDFRIITHDILLGRDDSRRILDDRHIPRM